MYFEVVKSYKVPSTASNATVTHDGSLKVVSLQRASDDKEFGHLVLDEDGTASVYAGAGYWTKPDIESYCRDAEDDLSLLPEHWNVQNSTPWTKGSTFTKLATAIFK